MSSRTLRNTEGYNGPPEGGPTTESAQPPHSHVDPAGGHRVPSPACWWQPRKHSPRETRRQRHTLAARGSEPSRAVPRPPSTT